MLRVRIARPTDRLEEVVAFGSESIAAVAAARLADSGYPDIEPENPYWEGRSITVADPDGWRVVLDWGLAEG